jgi:hypothetical protein
MRTRFALVAGAALGVLLAAAGPAGAKTPKKAATASETAVLKQEVEELKGEVRDLEARLNAQAQTQQQTQAQAQAAAAAAQAAQSQAATAQTAAQAAQTQADNNSTEIKTIPTTVEKEAKASKGGWWNNGWWGDTKIGVTMFSDFSYIDNYNAKGNTAQTGLGFDIKRLYLIVDHKFNNTYSFEAVTDFTYDNNSTVPIPCVKPGTPVGCTSLVPSNTPGGANTAGGIKSTQLYIKKAYLQANYADAFNIQLGGADMPWVPFLESLYPYRFAEKVLIDRTNFGTSADWGLFFYGNLFQKIVSYRIAVVDGEGYKQPAIGNQNRTHTMDFEGRLSATYDHFTAAVGGYNGKLGNSVYGVDTFQNAERFDALLFYDNYHAKFGAEYLWARYWKDVTQPNPLKTNETSGYSLFASYDFTSMLGAWGHPNISIFGKYEWLKPSANTGPWLTNNYFNVGVDYKPINQLDVALVFKRDLVFNSVFTDANGTIGIPTGVIPGPGAGRGTYDEIGVFTQVKF